ncbi:type IV secretion system DNA-binding domain-containing protein [Anthocerotibacter panamensis]|uniref:type IV secretion system DNA-binding domain-containing protein n=1 Tax=Anthocerotibacter panamensis TaxID=2857077 RepID=UPI001C4082EE|nr:type IV secretion system DNA-binding domain-containing protein [Anthocerotibacter panamensis]
MRTPRGSEVARNNISMGWGNFRWLAGWGLSAFFIVFFVVGFLLTKDHLSGAMQELFTLNLVPDSSLPPTLDFEAAHRRQERDFVLLGLGLAAVAGVGAAVLVDWYWISLFSRQEEDLEEETFLRGTQKSGVAELNARIEEEGLDGDLRLGEALLPVGMEDRSLLITGSQGTGKSTLIMQLMDAIETRHDGVVTYDKTGGYVRAYYTPERGDIILNPFDDKGAIWNPWAEGENYESIAESLIPENPQADPFWPSSARKILVALLKRVRTNQQLAYAIDQLDPKAMAKLLEGDGATRVLAESEMAASVLATLATAVGCFSYLKDGDGAFSLRTWIKEGRAGWIFLTCPQAYQERIKPLISLWFDLLSKGLLEREERSDGPRTWFVLDELASLQALPSLPNLLAEGRKYRGAVVLGFQTMAQVEHIYAEKQARAIAATCRTKVFLATEEEYTAEWISKTIGDQEIEELKESLSMGPSENRDGVSLSRQVRTRRAVMAAEIMNLPDLTAFLKLHGGYPVCLIKLIPCQRPDRMKALEERKRLADLQRLEHRPILLLPAPTDSGLEDRVVRAPSVVPPAQSVVSAQLAEEGWE